MVICIYIWDMKSHVWYTCSRSHVYPTSFLLQHTATDLMCTIRRFCCNTLQQISCILYVISVWSRAYHLSFLLQHTATDHMSFLCDVYRHTSWYICIYTWHIEWRIWYTSFLLQHAATDLMYIIYHLGLIWFLSYVISVATHCNRSYVDYKSFLLVI